MNLESINPEARSTFRHLGPQLHELLAEIRRMRAAVGPEHHAGIDKAVRDAVEEALRPADPESGTTAIEQAKTPAAVANELHKAVEANTIVDDGGEKTNGDAPIVHDVTEPAPGPVNAEVPKIPVTAEKVMEGVHSGTEAGEAPAAAHDPDKQYPVDKATLTADNGLAQSKTAPDGKKEAKSARKARTKQAAKNAGNPSEVH